METQQDVPFSLDDITEDWLTNALSGTEFLPTGNVSSIDINPLGEQVGFNGEVAILTPTYSSATEQTAPQPAPRSLVLKIPTASKNRILGQTMGLYEKEIRFYRDLSHELNIRVPRHYYSALDIADDADVILKRLQGMNRLPIWVIRILMALATKSISSNPRKYALLIEDLSSYRMGDQTSGCSETELHQIIVTMARLHAQFWNSGQLQKMSWIAPYAVTSRIMQMRFLQTVDKHLADPDAHPNAKQSELLQWLRKNGIALTETYGNTKPTLLHGDFRLDNICFDASTNEVVLFDWQTMLAGPGGSDLAYFISATLPVDADEDQVNALIERYHSELTNQGINVEQEHLRWQYDVGMLNMLHRVLPTIYQGDMDLDAERGLPLLKAWLNRIYARLESFDHNELAHLSAR